MATSNQQELQFILKMRDEASSILSRYNSNLGGTGSAAKGASDEVSKTTVNLKQAAAAATALGAQLIEMSRSANAFRTFQKEMADVNTLIPNTGSRIKDLSQQVKLLSLEQGNSLSVTSRGLYQVISAFGDATDSIEKLRVADKTAIAGLSTTQEAVSLLSSVTKAYGDTSAKSLEHVSDLAFETVRLGETTFPELASSMYRVTGIAATLGVTQEELFGVMATGTGVLGTASEVSTGLRQILQSLLNPTKQMSDLLHQWGYTSGQAALKSMGLVETVHRLADAVQQTADKGIRNQIIPGIEGLNAALTLGGKQFDTFKQKTQDMYKAAGATQRSFQLQQDTLDGSMRKLEASIEVLRVAYGSALAPAINLAATSVTGLTEAFTELPQPMQKAIADFGVLITSFTAMKAAVALVKALSPAFAAAAASESAFLATTQALLGPLNLVLLAAGGIAALTYNEYVPSTDMAKKVTDEHQAALLQLSTALDQVGSDGKTTLQTINDIAAANVKAAAAAKTATEAQLKQAQSALESFPKSTKEFVGDMLFGRKGQQAAQVKDAQEAAKRAAEAYKQTLQENIEAKQNAPIRAFRNADAASMKSLQDLQNQPINKGETKLIADPEGLQKLIDKVAPAIGRLKEYNTQMDQLKQLTTASDTQLKAFGITREQANQILAHAKEVLIDNNDVVEQSITKSNEAIANSKLDADQRAVAQQQIELENAARKQGIDLMGKEAQQRLELAKAKIAEAAAEQKKASFRESTQDQLRQLDIQTQLSKVAPDQRERAQALATYAIAAEKAYGPAAQEYIQRYAEAWDRAHKAQQEADVRSGVESDIRALQQQVALAGTFGEAYDRQAQLVKVAMDAQKAGITDILPLLKQYQDAWAKIDAQQQGATGAMNGMHSAFQSFIDEGKNMSAQFTDITQNALDGFVDNTATALATGKADWGSYFASIGSMLLKAGLKNMLANVFDKNGLGGKKVDPNAAIKTASGLNGFQLGSSPANAVWVRSADGAIGAALGNPLVPDSQTGKAPAIPVTKGAPLAPALAAPTSAVGGGTAMAIYKQAIKDIESAGGNYGAVGALTKSGDRAYGAYQVMGKNVGPWTQQAVGYQMTPNQFLAAPWAQDKVFEQQFGASINKYGNPSDAASVWFTGRPRNAASARATDVNGTTGAGYVGKFDANVAKYSQAGSGIDQMGTSVSRLSEQVTQAKSTLTQAGQSAQMTGNSFRQASTSTQQAGMQAQQAAPKFEQAGTAVQQAGQKAQTAQPAVAGFGQKAAGLQQPLEGAQGSMSIFTQSLQNLFGFGGGGAGGGGGFGSIFSIIGSLFGFADGGVMTRNGPRALKRYASGGVSNKAAIFGEGPTPEAAVPLPDGRNIPVRLEGKMAQPQSSTGGPAISTTNVFSPTVQITNNGPTDDKSSDEMAAKMQSKLQAMFDQKYAEQTQNQLRGGGMLRGRGMY